MQWTVFAVFLIASLIPEYSDWAKQCVFLFWLCNGRHSTAFFNVGGLFDEEVAKMLKEHSCRGSHSYFSTAKYVAYGFCSVWIFHFTESAFQSLGLLELLFKLISTCLILNIAHSLFELFTIVFLYSGHQYFKTFLFYIFFFHFFFSHVVSALHYSTVITWCRCFSFQNIKGAATWQKGCIGCRLSITTRWYMWAVQTTVKTSGPWVSLSSL